MKLSEIVQRINGNIDRFTTELEFYIGGEHMESSELEILNRGLLKENLGKLGFKFHFAFQERDVLFMARNPHLRKAGMVMFSGLCSDATYVLRSKDENIISQEFLAIQLQTDHFWDYCERTKVGSVNFANNWSSIANYDFDLPPINIQKEVASKVWSAYRVKQSYRKLLNAIDDMVKSQFIEMFKGCKMTQLKKVACFSKASINPIKGVKYTLFSFPAFDNNCIPEFVDGGEIKSSKIKLEENVILYNKLNVRLSRVWNINELSSNNNVCSSEFLPVKVTDKDLITKSFLYRILCSEDVTKKMVACSTGTSNSQKRITPASLLSLDIPIPSKEEQMKFVEIAEQADKSKFELKKSIEAIDKVIKSLINNI